MDKLVICTLGTSIANKCKSQSSCFKDFATFGWDDSNETYEQLEREIDERISNFDLSKERDILSVSAEANTLHGIGITSHDRVMLLATDTRLGNICSRKVKRVLNEAFCLPECNVEIKRIEGLQITDEKKLRETGLRNLVNYVGEILRGDESFQYDIILNPTGGYKGIVPFLTVLGMLFDKRSVYRFETSNALISLPPLPLTYNVEIFSRAKRALEFVEKESAITEQHYLSLIENFQDSERPMFLSFTEPLDDNYITLSPLAFCLLSISENAKGLEISANAREDLERILKTPHREKMISLLNKVKDPILRNIARDSWNLTDLVVYKNYRSTERVAGFYKDNVYKITHVFAEDHEEYEKALKQRYKKEFEDLVFSPIDEKIF